MKFALPVNRNDVHSDERGFSLIEIIFVIALLGTLMTILFRAVQGPTEQAKVDEAKLAMGGPLQQGLQLYHIHNHKYPSAEQGLNALIKDPGDTKGWAGPYISDNQTRDPWQNEIKYESDGRNFKMISPGPDGQFGTTDDVTYPEESKGEK